MKFRTKLKKTLNIKFHSVSVYEEKYIKSKVKAFNGEVNTKFWGDEVLNEGVHYTWIVCISIDYVMKMGKKLSTSLFRRIQV